MLPEEPNVAQTVRAFHHEENVAWDDSNWPKLWSRVLRRVFDEKLDARSLDIGIRNELIELMAVVTQVFYSIKL